MDANRHDVIHDVVFRRHVRKDAMDQTRLFAFLNLTVPEMSCFFRHTLRYPASLSLISVGYSLTREVTNAMNPL